MRRRLLLFWLFFQVRDLTCPFRGEVFTFSIMQLTIADVNTTRMYHFEANGKDNSPNTEHHLALVPSHNGGDTQGALLFS